MTETNELSHTIERVEQLLNQGEISGALTCLEYVKNHALTAVKLINDQNALLTKQQINLNKANSAYTLMNQAHFHWKDRARFAESKLPAEYHMDAGDFSPIWKEAADLMLEIERLEYWQNRARSAEAEIKGLDEQEPVGTCKVWNAGGSGEHKELWGIENLTHGQQVYARPVPSKSVPDGYCLLKKDDLLSLTFSFDGREKLLNLIGE